MSLLSLKICLQSSNFHCANILQEESNSIQKIEAKIKAEQLEMNNEKDVDSLTDNLLKEYFIKKKHKILMKMSTGE
ncbi:hypothetical protein VP01_5452g1 [Puccinia sorghi]|uniref:Uncharacterized protein n=1 Tax=Puccinia sorghi TaxID=27349 RepID=A0A0L6UKB8_9BASI|nr:hypothetical protein VP01_5452g1 [Puccinia sorghi]